MNRPLAIHGNVIHRQIYQNPLTKLFQERKKNDSKWSSKRRPSLCPTGNVAKKYEDLAEIKVHVCQLQLELLQKSCQQQRQKNDMEIETMDRKNKREEEEFERKRL
ncbi:unnamed protein product [Tenebrio molitor]|nr:unnamed protein product [Tenebrio molitor]